MGSPEAPEGIAVRRADVADVAALAALNRDVQALHASLEPARFKPPGPNAPGTEEFAAIVAGPRNVVLLAELAAQPVGYAYAEVRRRAESAYAYAYDEVYLHHLAVAPAWRRRGVGGALVSAMTEAAHALGIARLALDVWTANAAAGSFFRAQGFVPYNERLARGGWGTDHGSPAA